MISAQALATNGSPGEDVRERRIGRVVEGYDRIIEWLAAPITNAIQASQHRDWRVMGAWPR